MGFMLKMELMNRIVLEMIMTISLSLQSGVKQGTHYF
jgi:hypothetical protein